MKILFFDTETTGKPKDWNASVNNLSNWPRLVQLAWQIYDYSGSLVEEHDHIIKPEGFTIPLEATKIHKISTEIANDKGQSLIKVLKIFFNSVDQVDLLVAHNIDFDYKIMASEFIRNGLDDNLISKKKICTMKTTTQFCKIDGPYGYKWPKLEELYYHLFKDNFNAHNALDDIRACARCFWELILIKVIELPIIQQEKKNNLTNPVPYIGIKRFIPKSSDLLNSHYKQLISESLSIISNINEGERSTAYEAISKILMKRGLKDEAINVASMIKSQTTLDQNVYGDLSKILMNRGEKEEALRITALIKSRFWKQSAYCRLAIILFKHGKKTEAIDLASNHVSNCMFYSDLAPLLMKYGEEEKALRFISEISDYFYKGCAYLDISKILMKRGEKEKALEFISKIDIDGNDIHNLGDEIEDYYADFSIILMKSGNIDDALSTASLIGNYQLEQITYAKICALLMQHGNVEEALNVASKTIDNPEFHHSSLEPHITIIRILMEQGQRERAMSEAAKIKNLEIRSESYVSICEFLLENGCRKEAETIALKQKLNEKFSEVLSKVLIKQGEMEEALNVVSNISCDYTRDFLYNAIALKLMSIGKKEKALSVNLLIEDKTWETEFYTQQAIKIINPSYSPRKSSLDYNCYLDEKLNTIYNLDLKFK